MSQVNPLAKAAATADPRVMLYNLLTDMVKGIAITADDNSTVLTANISVPSSSVVNVDSPLIDVQLHPFAQEGKGPRPQVMIGPAKPVLFKPLDMPTTMWQIEQDVQIRVLCRNSDYNEFPYTTDGNNTRVKLVNNIRSIIRTNQLNPDGTGTFNWIHLVDNGQDTDTAVGEGVQMYRTMLTVRCQWFESNSETL